MEITIITAEINAEVALSALRCYRNGQFKDALGKLQDILDVEPTNWQARLYLAACFFKTAQPAAAQRTLRYIYDNCPDETLRKKAFEALRVINAETTHKTFEVAAEFGGVVERMQRPVTTTIESIIS